MLFKLKAIIIFFCFSFYGLAQNYETNSSYAFAEKGIYKICKRPLKTNQSFIQPIMKLLNFTWLEKESLNTQHFQFFRVKNNETYINNFMLPNNLYSKQSFNYNDYIPTAANRTYVDKMCSKNDFSNFGFSNNSKIVCDENISEYETCSEQSFDDIELRAALEILMTDFMDREYSVTSYNCQSFTNNLFNVLDSVKQQGYPVCVVVNYPNKSLISRVFDSFIDFIQGNDEKEIFDFSKKFTWEKANKCYTNR